MRLEQLNQCIIYVTVIFNECWVWFLFILLKNRNIFHSLINSVSQLILIKLQEKKETKLASLPILRQFFLFSQQIDIRIYIQRAITETRNKQ